MKKYCLTKCFKTKIRDTKDRIAEFLSFVFIVLAMFIGVEFVLTIIGLTINGISSIYQIQWLVQERYFNPLIVGIVFICILAIMAILLTAIGYLTIRAFKVIHSFYRGLANSIRPMLGKESYKDECKIFEECKE